LPDSLLDILSIENANKDDVGALRKLRMVLDQGPQPPPVNRFEVVYEHTAIRIAHLQGGYFEGLAIDDERVINHAIDSFGRLHWDRGRFESRLAQFRSEKEGPFARTLEQGVAFNSLSSLQSQEIVRPKAVKIEISSGTTRPVAGHPGFAAVGIVNPH